MFIKCTKTVVPEYTLQYVNEWLVVVKISKQIPAELCR